MDGVVVEGMQNTAELSIISTVDDVTNDVDHTADQEDLVFTPVEENEDAAAAADVEENEDAAATEDAVEVEAERPCNALPVKTLEGETLLDWLGDDGLVPVGKVSRAAQTFAKWAGSTKVCTHASISNGSSRSTNIDGAQWRQATCNV